MDTNTTLVKLDRQHTRAQPFYQKLFFLSRQDGHFDMVCAACHSGHYYYWRQSVLDAEQVGIIKRTHIASGWNIQTSGIQSMLGKVKSFGHADSVSSGRLASDSC